MVNPELADKIIDKIKEGDIIDLEDLGSFIKDAGITFDGELVDPDGDALFTSEFLLDISMNKNVASASMSFFLLKLDEKKGLIYYSDYNNDDGTFIIHLENYTSKDELKKFVFDFLPAHPEYFLDEINDYAMGTMFGESDERRFENRFVVASDWSGKNSLEAEWDDDLDMADDDYDSYNENDDGYEDDDDDYRY
jgi:hypothetical protein